MATGYLDMPELSREEFKDGFFFMGDLGKKDEQGRLYITGRKKIFIDSGGEKVDPWEIEQALLAHPTVKEAAVVGIAGPYGCRMSAILSMISTIRISMHRARPFRVGVVFSMR
jgi:long-chain acyl-CoA synthetase